MNEFLRLSSPSDALNSFFDQIHAISLPIDTIRTEEAMGRVVAVDVLASHPMPEFSRSAVDGYAVRARDTHGASDSQPAYLNLVGEIRMGETAKPLVREADCYLIHTGGMLPENATAVVMKEDTQAVDDLIEVFRAVGTGDNVIHAGEDLQEGVVAVQAGTLMGPAAIGGCMALGVMNIQVKKRPRVGIISSGDEVIHPAQRPALGKVRDVNSYSLAALVQRAGGEPVLYGIVSDDAVSLASRVTKGIRECDVVIITAGSSASARDITAKVVDSLGHPGVIVHGLNIRPGKPTILGVVDGKAVIGLPGNPISALVVAGLIVRPVIRKILGVGQPALHGVVLAQNMTNIHSQAGREDWVTARLAPLPDPQQNKFVRYQVEPILGKSNMIFTLVGADGLLYIPADVTGYQAGDIVEVVLLESFI